MCEVFVVDPASLIIASDGAGSLRRRWAFAPDFAELATTVTVASQRARFDSPLASIRATSTCAHGVPAGGGAHENRSAGVRGIVYRSSGGGRAQVRGSGV